jgi:hypothetical protein
MVLQTENLFKGYPQFVVLGKFNVSFERFRYYQGTW